MQWKSYFEHGKFKFFKDYKTLEDLKAQYRNLILIHHPDRGGDTANHEALVEEYKFLFEQYKNTHRDKYGRTYTVKGKKKTDEKCTDFVNIMDCLLTLDGIEIEVCGRFTWITGNFKKHKETLSKLDFGYCKDKKAWYYEYSFLNKKSKNWTLDRIRDTFGTQIVIKQPDVWTDDVPF
jgi:curved DNA-binding protein CbpA